MSANEPTRIRSNSTSASDKHTHVRAGQEECVARKVSHHGIASDVEVTTASVREIDTALPLRHLFLKVRSPAFFFTPRVESEIHRPFLVRHSRRAVLKTTGVMRLNDKLYKLMILCMNVMFRGWWRFICIYVRARNPSKPFLEPALFGTLVSICS
jgi:hypothetical protein